MQNAGQIFLLVAMKLGIQITALNREWYTFSFQFNGVSALVPDRNM